MGKVLIRLAKFLVLTALVTMPFQDMVRAKKPDLGSGTTWAKTTVVHGNECKTKMEFYLHELLFGESATLIEVVRAPGSNQPFTGFGHILMFDDLLRVGSDPNTTLVGRAQGMAGGASQPDGIKAIMSFALTFSDGIYNGSSLSILGLNPIMDPTRELPVVGGTKFFRMARGYAVLRAHTFDTTRGILIVGYNLTAFHACDTSFA